MRDVKSAAGSIRAERADATRRRIEDAARARFTRDGYAATTLRQIAVDAGVAVQTVYAVHGSKANLVRALVLRLRDDPGADEAFSDALDAGTPDLALKAFARSIRRRWEGGSDIVAIHGDAASADPDLRADAEAALAARRRGIASLAERVSSLGGHPGHAAELAAVIDALTLPELFIELTVVHGWTAGRYEAWLSEALRAAAIPSAERSRSGVAVRQPGIDGTVDDGAV